MRFGSTAEVLLKCKLKYYRISECITVVSGLVQSTLLGLLSASLTWLGRYLIALHGWHLTSPTHTSNGSLWMLTGLARRYIHPKGIAGFSTPELGQAFRKKAFADHKLDAPAKAPQTITLLSAHGGEEVCIPPSKWQAARLAQ